MPERTVDPDTAAGQGTTRAEVLTVRLNPAQVSDLRRWLMSATEGGVTLRQEARSEALSIAAALDAALAPAESADPDARLTAVAALAGELEAERAAALLPPSSIARRIRAALGDPAATLAKARADALREAAEAGPASTATDQLWRMFLNNRADRIEAEGI